MANIYSKIYNNWLKYNFMEYKNGKVKYKFRAKICAMLYNVVRRMGDPEIEAPINGQMMIMPFSQMTPAYMAKHPYYDRQIGNICKYIAEAKSDINIVDVGANIGDTVVNIGLHNARYLCVEGVKKYAEILKKNLDEKYNYELVQCFISDSEEVGYKEKLVNGTAALVSGEDGKSEIQFQSLDMIIATRNINPDIIKIDTDGFDFKVLRSGMKIIEEYKPLLFFEWDPILLKRNDENPISIFELLNNTGYEDIVLFDYLGNILSVMKTEDVRKLELFAQYTSCGTITYYDVLMLHKDSEFCVDNILNAINV